MRWDRNPKISQRNIPARALVVSKVPENIAIFFIRIKKYVIKDNKMENPYKNMISASIATSIAEFATLPICTIKTNFQNVKDMRVKPSLVDISKNIYKRGGVKAFYAASYPAIAGQVFSTTSKYTLYRYFDTNPDYPVKNKFLNGLTAGVLSSIFTHPMDVVKVHMQMDKKLDGLFGIYRGYSKTFVKIGISSSIFFPMYDIINGRVDNKYLSSTCSGVLACMLMHPVDYLKTRHMAGLSLYEGWNPMLYYRGLSVNMMRIVPHFVITIGVIEFVRCSTFF